MTIVSVQFKNRHSEGYGGKEYTYLADIPVSVGDIVNVPTKYGDSEAMVRKVDVPVTDIQCRVGELKHITEHGTPGSMFDSFLN